MTGVSGFNLLGGNDEFITSFDTFGRYKSKRQIAISEDRVFANSPAGTLSSFDKNTRMKISQVSGISNADLYMVGDNLIGCRSDNDQYNFQLYDSNCVFVKTITPGGIVISVIKDGNNFWLHSAVSAGHINNLSKYDNKGNILLKFELVWGNVVNTAPKFCVADSSNIYLSKGTNIVKINKVNGSSTISSFDFAETVTRICEIGDYLFIGFATSNLKKVRKADLTLVAEYTHKRLLGQCKNSIYVQDNRAYEYELTDSTSSLIMPSLTAYDENVMAKRTSSIEGDPGTISIDNLDKSGSPIIYYTATINTITLLKRAIDRGGKV